MVYLLGSFLLSPAPDRSSHEDTFCTQTERDTAAIFYGCHAHCVPGVLLVLYWSQIERGWEETAFGQLPVLCSRQTFQRPLGVSSKRASVFVDLPRVTHASTHHSCTKECTDRFSTWAGPFLGDLVFALLCFVPGDISRFLCFGTSDFWNSSLKIVKHLAQMAEFVWDLRADAC